MIDYWCVKGLTRDTAGQERFRTITKVENVRMHIFAFKYNNCFTGLDWYMSFFPLPKNSTAKFLFEKSATYFDG